VKHDILRSIAHNVADSFASGIGLPLGYYATDVFGEATRSPEGFITVDFLEGTVVTGRASTPLKKAVGLYRVVLADVSARHGASLSDFRTLIAHYSADKHGRRVVVTIEDSEARRSIDEYAGHPLRHIKTVDNAGRVRTSRKPRRH
jgi:hypothetical protein